MAGRGQDGVDGVALWPSEIVAVHAVAVLDQARRRSGGASRA